MKKLLLIVLCTLFAFGASAQLRVPSGDAVKRANSSAIPSYIITGGDTLPACTVVGTRTGGKEDSFFMLTATDGDNGPGLYRCSNGTWISAEQSPVDYSIDPTDGALLEILAEREAIDTTFTLGTLIRGWSPNPVQGTQQGSFSPPLPTGALGTVCRIIQETNSLVVSGVQLQHRVIVEIQEGVNERTYQGASIRWTDPSSNTIASGTLTYLNRDLNNCNRYYSPAWTYRPAGGGTVLFNLEDIAAEQHETFPGDAWIWHSQAYRALMAGVDIMPLNCTAGQIAKRNSANTAWECAEDISGSGGGITLDQAADEVGADFNALAQFTYDSSTNAYTIVGDSFTGTQISGLEIGDLGSTLTTTINGKLDATAQRLVRLTSIGAASTGISLTFSTESTTNNSVNITPDKFRTAIGNASATVAGLMSTTDFSKLATYPLVSATGCDAGDPIELNAAGTAFECGTDDTGSGGGITLDQSRDAFGSIIGALTAFTYDSTANTLTTTIPTTFAPVGAEANVQANWTETTTTSDAFILNKPSNIVNSFTSFSEITVSNLPRVRLTYTQNGGGMQLDITQSNFRHGLGVPSANCSDGQVWKFGSDGSISCQDDDGGSGGGLTESQVDTRISTLTDNWALVANPTVTIPIGKLDASLDATTLPLRIAWGDTSTFTETSFTATGANAVSGTTAGLNIPAYTGTNNTAFLAYWIGGQADSVRSITENFSPLDAGEWNFASPTALTVDGVAGTLWVTTVQRDPALAGLTIRATLAPSHLGDQIDERVLDLTADWAERDHTALIPLNKLPTSIFRGVGNPSSVGTNLRLPFTTTNGSTVNMDVHRGVIMAVIGNASAGTAGYMTAANFTKLGNIAAGAEVNVQADWNQTTTTHDAFIQNKPTLVHAISTTSLLAETTLAVPSSTTRTELGGTAPATANLVAAGDQIRVQLRRDGTSDPFTSVVIESSVIAGWTRSNTWTEANSHRLVDETASYHLDLFVGANGLFQLRSAGSTRTYIFIIDRLTTKFVESLAESNGNWVITYADDTTDTIDATTDLSIDQTAVPGQFLTLQSSTGDNVNFTSANGTNAGLLTPGHWEILTHLVATCSANEILKWSGAADGGNGAFICAADDSGTSTLATQYFYEDGATARERTLEQINSITNANEWSQFTLTTPRNNTGADIGLRYRVEFASSASESYPQSSSSVGLTFHAFSSVSGADTFGTNDNTASIPDTHFWSLPVGRYDLELAIKLSHHWSGNTVIELRQVVATTTSDDTEVANAWYFTSRQKNISLKLDDFNVSNANNRYYFLVDTTDDSPRSSFYLKVSQK